MADDGATYYPPVGFHFEVEVLGVEGATATDMRFQEVSGLNQEVGLESLKEGGQNQFEHRFPSRSKYGNLVLKRGMVIDSGLYKWFKDAVSGVEYAPKEVNVKLMTSVAGVFVPLATWSFVNAFPVKWSVSNFKATESAIVIDTIELAYQYFERKEL